MARFEEADQQLALQCMPNSAWVYYGQAELARARGDAAAAKQADEALARTWVGDRGLLRLSRL
jgi:hypothetical protein